MTPYRRNSLRLKDYNYSQEGVYFVTICTKDRKNYFANFERLTKIVHVEWHQLPLQFFNVQLDEFVIMPNHVHGILCIVENNRRGLIYQTPNYAAREKGVMNHAPTQQKLINRSAAALGQIVRYFKAKCTKLIHDHGNTDFQWQRGYYDHIVRNERDLNRIRQYIQGNPIQWDEDENNPKNWKD